MNLHYQCHHLFHYDVPWSIIRLTQRNGRIDRFGQHQTPQLRYLVTQTKARTADQRVVERLIEKEREVERQLGDSGALLGLYDPDSEEEFLLRGVARGDDVEALIPDEPLPPGKASEILREQGVPTEATSIEGTGAIDLLALFAEVEKEQTRAPALEKLVADPPSLFRNDYELLVAALRHLERHDVVGAEPIKWSHDDATTSVEVFSPEPFRRHREGFLPREAVPERNSPYRLTMGRDLITSKLRAALGHRDHPRYELRRKLVKVQADTLPRIGIWRPGSRARRIPLRPIRCSPNASHGAIVVPRFRIGCIMFSRFRSWP